MIKFAPHFSKHSPLWYVTVTSLPALFLLTVIGPFGTYTNFSLIERLLYWTAMLASCGPVFEATVPKFLHSVKLSLRFSRFQRFVLGVLTSIACSFWLVLAVEYVSRGPFDAGRVPHLLLGLFVIGFTISYFRFMFRSSATHELGDEVDINYERIAFFDDYPELIGSRILWITMQDHYARVVFEDTEVVVHSSMSELDLKLKNYPGMRIHRSHWVAYASLRGLKRSGRSFQVDLGDDRSLPVGGTYLKQVEQISARLAQWDRLRVGKTWGSRCKCDSGLITDGMD